MPRRPDIRKVMVIGSGPIVIGQAAEFDYSGTQTHKASGKERLESASGGKRNGKVDAGDSRRSF